MPRLERALKGPRLFVKRDDLTGLALGGNKVRKLDFLLVEARRKKADVVITTCGIQSNWSRQTAGAAVKLGMKAVLVLRTAQFKQAPRVYDGNLLLDHIMGAKVSFVKMKIDEDPREVLESVAKKLRKRGHTPYVLHLATAESPLATVAYVQAMYELMNQCNTVGVRLDYVVTATAGGSTHAGLILGAKLLGADTKVVGINVGAYKKQTIAKTIQESSEGAAGILKSKARVEDSDIAISDNYKGRGYGIPTKGTLNAITQVAQTEALILDPVYTGKAMNGLIDLVKRGYFKKDDNVCFLHTGGIPALFAYKEHFSPRISK
jgi:D-cysteine desulfhydrase family pyridoxal phosphate-dependent enzyme